jgi:hypothetical protein
MLLELTIPETLLVVVVVVVVVVEVYILFGAKKKGLKSGS